MGKRGGKSGEKTHRYSWTTVSTGALISIWGLPEHRDELNKTHNIGWVYEAIADEMRQLDMIVTKEQVQNKIKNLRTAYKEEELRQKKSGSGSSEMEFYHELSAIIGSDEDINPIGVSQAGVSELIGEEHIAEPGDTSYLTSNFYKDSGATSSVTNHLNPVTSSPNSLTSSTLTESGDVQENEESESETFYDSQMYLYNDETVVNTAKMAHTSRDQGGNRNGVRFTRPQTTQSHAALNKQQINQDLRSRNTVRNMSSLPNVLNQQINNHEDGHRRRCARGIPENSTQAQAPPKQNGQENPLQPRTSQNQLRRQPRPGQPLMTQNQARRQPQPNQPLHTQNHTGQLHTLVAQNQAAAQLQPNQPMVPQNQAQQQQEHDNIGNDHHNNNRQDNPLQAQQGAQYGHANGNNNADNNHQVNHGRQRGGGRGGRNYQAPQRGVNHAPPGVENIQRQGARRGRSNVAILQQNLGLLREQNEELAERFTRTDNEFMALQQELSQEVIQNYVEVHENHLMAAREKQENELKHNEQLVRLKHELALEREEKKQTLKHKLAMERLEHEYKLKHARTLDLEKHSRYEGTSGDYSLSGGFMRNLPDFGHI